MLFELFKSLDKKVEEDKERLVSELKSADIKTLIIQMDNNEPISKNIIKKQKRDMSFGSEDSPSWFAYRVSDELSDKNLKPELIKLLSDRATALKLFSTSLDNLPKKLWISVGFQSFVSY